MKNPAALVFLTDGFEDMEAVVPVDVLRRGGVDVTTVSLTESLTVRGSLGTAIIADALFADGFEADLLCLPGGPGHVKYKEHAGLLSLIESQAQSGKLVAAICAAPTVLGGMGLLKGKRAVCYPGMESGLVGAEVSDADVVVSGNIVTAKGPATALKFALTLHELLLGKKAADNVRAQITAEA